jgi:hypothetical protein
MKANRATLYGSQGLLGNLGFAPTAVSDLQNIARTEGIPVFVVMATRPVREFYSQQGSSWPALQETLPDPVPDFGVATRSILGKQRTIIFNATDGLLVDMRGAKPVIVDGVLGSNGTQLWPELRTPKDLDTLTVETLAGARPILELLFDSQTALLVELLGAASGSPAGAPSGQ